MSTNVNTATCNINTARRFNYKWGLGLIMVTVIALGWKLPLFGFIVPVAMATGILGGFFRGRWVCGNLCPRGSFLDSWFTLVSAKKEIPTFLKGNRFRWAVLLLLMGFMAYRLGQNPSDLYHWGHVFWQMCLITTIVAIGLGLRFSARSWCTFCPVGTLASSVGGNKYPLQVSLSCKACGHCEDSCPMQLEIAKYRYTVASKEKDCLKCSECIKTCPQNNVLSWPTQNKS